LLDFHSKTSVDRTLEKQPSYSSGRPGLGPRAGQNFVKKKIKMGGALSEYISFFSCQFSSTNIPYPSIHHSPTLCNLSTSRCLKQSRLRSMVVKGRVSAQLSVLEKLYWVDDMFRPQFWAIIRSRRKISVDENYAVTHLVVL
jgi:hypothetical protein